MNDGVFLNPDNGDIIATGIVSASQFTVGDKYDYRVGTTPLYDVLSNQLSGYYKQSETSSSSQLSDEFLLINEKSLQFDQLIYNYDRNHHIEAELNDGSNVIVVTNNVNYKLSIDTRLSDSSTFEDVMVNISAIYNKLVLDPPVLSVFDDVISSLNYVLNEIPSLSDAYTIKQAILDLRAGYAKRSYVTEQIEYLSGLLHQDYGLSVENLNSGIDGLKSDVSEVSGNLDTLYTFVDEFYEGYDQNFRNLSSYSDRISSDLSSLRDVVSEMPEQMSSFVSAYVEEHGSNVLLKIWDD